MEYSMILFNLQSDSCWSDKQLVCLDLYILSKDTNILEPLEVDFLIQSGGKHVKIDPFQIRVGLGFKTLSTVDKI